MYATERIIARARSLPRRMSQNERFNPDNWIRSIFFFFFLCRFIRGPRLCPVSYRFLFPRCVYCILAQLRKLRDEGLRLFVSGSRPPPVWQIATCKVSHCHSALKLLYVANECIRIRHLFRPSRYFFLSENLSFSDRINERIISS